MSKIEEYDAGQANGGFKARCPEHGAGVGRELEAAGRYADAANAFEAAAGVTLGHCRAERYESHARMLRKKEAA